MKKFNMGLGAGSGPHGTDARRVYTWLWHAWVEAQRELPVLRVLTALAAACVAAILVLAMGEGRTYLEVAVYTLTALLFVLVVPAIQYLLFEIYRYHRSDAIFDSKRLAGHIRAIAKEEVEAAAAGRQAPDGRLVYIEAEKGLKK